MPKQYFKQPKIFPELNFNEERKNPYYVSSGSDSDSECKNEKKDDNVCGIAFSINGKGVFPALQKQTLEDESDNEKKVMKGENFIDDVEFGDFELEDIFEEKKVMKEENFINDVEFGDLELEDIVEEENRWVETCLRSYSIASEKDDWNIRFGRCPDYAIDWGHNFNQKHWPPGHDYINGYKGSPRRHEFNVK
jgi:hypothetical protein